MGDKVALANPYEVLKEEDALQRRLEKQAERERRRRERREEKAAAAAAAAAASAAATAAAAAAAKAQLSPGAASLLQGARWADVEVDSEDDGPLTMTDPCRGVLSGGSIGGRRLHQRDAFYSDVETSSEDDLASGAAEDAHGEDLAASSSSSSEEDEAPAGREQQVRSPTDGRRKAKGEPTLPCNSLLPVRSSLPLCVCPSASAARV